ncbi:MAG: NUDIX hydrolase [Candidatus Marinimicrobia bacterium]|nr:NUDIX hydrolase [Candidatus Neomarinimicrobiota bacterium]
MTHTHLLAQLEVYFEKHPSEKQNVEEIKHFVQHHPDCLLPSYKPGHITGSAWILNSQKNKAILTHHRKLNTWIQLGGHADGEAVILSVAHREATEESGLQSVRPLSKEIFDIDIHTIPENKSMPEHLHYDIRFLFEADEHEPISVSDESFDVAWFPLHQIQEINSAESIFRMVRKCR